MKGFSWKNVGVLLFVMMLALTAVGCQSPSAVKEDGEKPKKKENESTEDVLNLLIPNYYNDVEKEQWVEVVDKFKGLNEGIEVVVETGDMQVESGSLPTLLQSGVNIPDAILMNAGPGRVAILSEAELIRPINDLYEEHKWAEKLRPYAYNLISGEENIYEVPHMIDAIGFFYNKDVFEKGGIDKAPETKEEFETTLEKLKDTGVPPITVGARNGYAVGWIFGVMMEAVAGKDKVENLFYGDGKWSDPEFVEVAEMLVDWVDKGYIAKESVTQAQPDSKFRFLSGQAGMEATGSYLITDISDQGLEENVHFFMMPSFIEGKTASPTGGIGQTWVIPTQAEDDELAEKWFDFIVSEEFSETVLNFPDYNFIPASQASVDMEPAGEALKTAMNFAKEGTGYNPSVFMGVDAKEAYFQNLQGLIGGLITAEEALDGIEIGAEKDRANGFKLKKQN
ncbi:extracellular solute-binding protein [Sporosarcina sp. E16_3]|uniref:ABC transporter substrate-binding protein n=1 Tax=Sporosarcina sp. E16_3 TaxID=2789293 RepID=UPI001A91C065|nr:extracellular solute-binding protein [Sporosarcina sp. E16_3]MBO0603372.1 extracellular solute-binding protein [Sporosarcina sp. E16_3]